MYQFLKPNTCGLVLKGNQKPFYGKNPKQDKLKIFSQMVGFEPGPPKCEAEINLLAIPPSKINFFYVASCLGRSYFVVWHSFFTYMLYGRCYSIFVIIVISNSWLCIRQDNFSFHSPHYC